MIFEPIAIVGQGCVLPGGLNPDELWTTVCEGRDVLGSPEPGYWGVSPAHILRDRKAESHLDHTWSDRGGYVRGFAEVFDPHDLLLDADEFDGLDPLYLWAVEAARQAIESAGWHAGEVPGSAGVILGNLSYPTKTMTDVAEKFWHREQRGIDWRNRFMSGLPSHLISNALGLTGGAASLDAACASSLYAIKLACDRLHDHTADVMVAGGANGASDLFLHIGFSALQALSHSGRSRPFHRGADGLVPAEGAAVLVLRRLEDAIADRNPILGLIRGVGLTNDGRGHGLLVPSQEGQERAMRLAYEMTDFEPQDISLIECHATGTSRGDLTELMSMARIFAGITDVPIGSLKSNLGHSITASGAAAVIKVLAAMHAGVRPPTLHADDPVPFIADSPFRLLTEAEPWVCGGPRRAAVNNFGFGGNNAHLLLEEWLKPTAEHSAQSSWRVSPPHADSDIAIVGLSLLVGDGHQTASVAQHLIENRPIVRDDGDGILRAQMTEVSLDLTHTRFPPNDLKQALPQQLAILAAASQIAPLIQGLPAETTSVVVGMGCDVEVTRYGLRWRLADEIDDPDQLLTARDGVMQALTAAGVVGAMPNIVANRLNSQFDLRGPSLTVSREQLSGTTALELAARALRRGEVDAAVVGAVDLSCEPVHEAASQVLLGPDEQIPGDAAVVMVLKRADDARRDDDTILAVLCADQKPHGDCLHLGNSEDALNLSQLLGHAHAASGLLSAAAGMLYGFLGVRPDGTPWTCAERAVIVDVTGLAGEQQRLVLVPPAPTHHDSDATRNDFLSAGRSQTDKSTLLHLPAHPPGLRLPTSVVAAHSSALHTQCRPAAAAEPDSMPAKRNHNGDQPPIPVPTDRAGHLTVPYRPEQLMTTHLPVPPVLPKVEEAFARVPLGICHPPTAAPTDSKPMHEQKRIDQRIDRAIQPSRPADKELPTPTVKRAPVGLTLDKHGLRVHASGKISDIYGPAFGVQDDFYRQTRMPEPPLLLADRLLGIDAEPATIGTGTLWTETDVTADGWWLHQGRMPAGIMIESGQADLMLISWMGADFANRGDRVYRLLGCEVTFLGGLPEIGDTLRFDIHVHGHARQGDIRMFFFHYDCTIDGVERLSVRNGQAGFFSDEELASSGGILWRPEDETISGPMESTPQQTSRTSLNRAELEALAAGQIWQTLGRGFERAASHTRTPCISGGDMLFIDEVTQLDFGGGPWGRGYLRAVAHVTPDAWFFAGHFKNDPCMPGTLMCEATLQTMALYMTALGMTLDYDGWRFEPVPFETYTLRCRGQVTPQSRELVYEVFVREVLAGPEPTLFADLLCTVDGLPAFHSRRVGLKLSPGWPMDLGAKELAGYVESKPVAEINGFRYDYKAMLASALGRPSTAIGPRFQGFDGHRRLARLPGPPYHFISRVIEVVAEIGVMKPGAEMVTEYDVPSDAWYFGANGASNGKETMPNAVLMEIGLQPCGWLTTHLGCPLSTDVDLYFRNLDGTATQHRQVTPSIGTLQTKVSLKNIVRAADTIIASFDVQISAGGTLVYTTDTVFGYFRREALEQQVGLPVTEEQRSLLELSCGAPVVDLRARPEEYFSSPARLADPMLLMIDRVTGRWPTGGSAGLGRWRAVKDVDPAEWFFKAHFYQDPVQPGSLGIEALLQLLQFAMLDLGLVKEAGPLAHFEPVALGEPIAWRYRGQVLPTHNLVTSLVEITRIARGDDAILAIADGSLWVDGRQIYRVTNLGMRIKRDAPEVRSPALPASPATPTSTSMEMIIDPARDTWIGDHCPTYTAPSLPMMSVLDLFAQAASRVAGTAKVVEVTDLRLDRWIVIDSPRRLRVIVESVEPGRFDARLEVWRDAPKPVLSRWETHAHATVFTANHYPCGPAAPPPLQDTAPFPSPYETRAIFHGPAFRTLVDGTRIGGSGASGILSVQRCQVPVGRLHPGLLDGALHVVPHTAMSVWTTKGSAVASYSEADDPTAGFPNRLVWARFYSDTPLDGEVKVEARFAGFDDADSRLPVIDLWLGVADRPWAVIRVVEILLPKGPLGQAGGLERSAFFAQRRAVPAVSLGQQLGQGVVRLDSARAATLDWYKGTLEAVYGTNSRGDSLIVDIATKEAVAHAAHGAIHPSQVRIATGEVSCPALPLEAVSVEVQQTGQHEFRATASLQTDWQPVRSWWLDSLGMRQGWFGDLFLEALFSRYVRHVIVTDPAAASTIRGRSVLLLANHQVQIESILGTFITSWLTDTRVVTIAHAKHENRWVGDLLRLIDALSSTKLDNIRYFDQRNPQQFFGLMDRSKNDVATHGVSIMVHADGTRHVRSGQRVENLTSTLLDLAIDLSMPIVPLYFAGGLPEEALDYKLEVPYRHTAQDYIFGSPIMPEELSALPYADRRRRVIDAINALAPFSDAPHEPNHLVEKRITAVSPGASPLESIWDCIEDALDALPVDWRSTISDDGWMIVRSTQHHVSTATRRP